MAHAAIHVQEGSANVYADMGYENASEMQRKSALVATIAVSIKARGGMSLADAAVSLGVDEAAFKRMMRGMFRSVSEQQLTEMVARLGHDAREVVVGAQQRNGAP